MNTLTLQVSETLSVGIMPNAEHEFLMSTKEVAFGYGVSDKTIRKHKVEHFDELTEGKHFVSAATFSSGRNFKHNTTLWTKRGIVRLGFFIKSERAKQFRDWAEDLIIYATEERQNSLEQRISKLEQELRPLPLNAPSYEDVIGNLDAFFSKWLQWGDLRRVAEQAGVNYVTVRTARTNPKVSRRLNRMLFEQCVKNMQANAEVKRMLN